MSYCFCDKDNDNDNDNAISIILNYEPVIYRTDDKLKINIHP